ncbi:MAG: Penicillin-binding protein 2D [Anaerolineales bacterium]|nr:Penicillin-binding protein 2D [Anaerolineales bacterium]
MKRNGNHYWLISRRRRRRRSKGNVVARGVIAGSVAALCFSLITPLLIAVAALLAGGVTTGIVYAALADELQQNLATLETIERRQIFQSTKIYDRNGKLLNEVFDEGRRTRVELSEVPVHMRQASIAVEDDTFYTNPGIDVGGILRSAWRLALYRQIMGGGSTITQQLVRHIAFSYEERVSQSYVRKFKEIILALILTQSRDKDEILEHYLNEIYYGNLSYGAEAAAQTFFGKPISEVTLPEATMLAGLPQAPLNLDPFTDLPAVKRRQETVLNLMVRSGFITQEEADAAYAEPLKLTPPKIEMLAPHFVIYVRKQLEEMFGPKMVTQGGLTVYTTVDLRFQRAAERLAREHVAELREEHNLTNAALVAVQPDTGQILAMLGSVDYADESIDGQVNVAVRERQPGSSIKPITYVTAFEQGMTPADVIWDVETEIPLEEGKVYRPQNYDEEFHGLVRLREALANSYNVPAIKLLREAGIAETLDTAHRMGIQGLQQAPNYYGLSLTLGGGEVTLLDLTTAYATLSNAGGYVPPQAIMWVTDSEGVVLYEYEPPKPQQVLDPRSVYLVTDILSDNEARTPEFGPDSALKVSQPAAAKTGTTNDFRDNWTLGYTPYLTVGVWAGNSDNGRMVDSSGLTGAGPLWHDFMEEVFASPALLSELRETLGDLPQVFERPAGIIEAEICRLASVREPTAECPEKRREVFIDPSVNEEDAESETADEEEQREPWEEEDVVFRRAPATRLPVAQVKALVEEIVAREEEAREKRREEFEIPEEEGAEEEEDLVQDTTEPEKPAVCPLPPGSAGPPTIFLLPPENEAERAKVREWALRHGWPVLIEELCVGEGVALPTGEVINATWRIKSPSSGDVVTTIVPIVGTASFNRDQVLFYKVEWGRGEEPGEWITMGQTHDQPVVDGQLEVWHAEGMPPGQYSLRLVLVKTDGNELPAYKVTVTVE